MEFLKYALLITILVLSSCSSDLCETLNCVNGNCIDGTCQCEEGYVGELCDQLPCVNGSTVNGKCDCQDGSFGILCDVTEIAGVYVATAFVMADCPSFATQYDIVKGENEDQLCGISEEGRDVCFLDNIFLDEDGRAFWTRSTNFEQEDGSIRTGFLEVFIGNYNAHNEVISISSDDGDFRSAIIDGNKIIRKWKVNDGGNDCYFTMEHTRVD